MLVAINVGNSHWCGSIVDREPKRVTIYDSMNSGLYRFKLDKIARQVASLAPDDVDIVCEFFAPVRQAQLRVFRVPEVLAAS